MQELLDQDSNLTGASASSLSHQLSDQDSLPGQANSHSGTSSEQATPRSLRPGTVPRLDLSPAIAIHVASLDDPDPDDAAAEEEEEETRASERQAAAMASFDDLSGPEASDTASPGSDKQDEVSQSADEHATAEDALDDEESAASSAASALLAVQQPDNDGRLDQSLQAATPVDTALEDTTDHSQAALEPRTSAQAAVSDNPHKTSIPSAIAIATAHVLPDVAAIPSDQQLAHITGEAAHHPQPASVTADRLDPRTGQGSADSASSASSVSEDVGLDSGGFSHEHSPESDHAVARLSDALGEASSASVSHHASDAGHLLISPSLQHQSLPGTAEEERHLAPQLLAYAEAALAEKQAGAELSPVVMGTAAAAKEAAQSTMSQQVSGTATVPKQMAGTKTELTNLSGSELSPRQMAGTDAVPALVCPDVQSPTDQLLSTAPDLGQLPNDDISAGVVQCAAEDSVSKGAMHQRADEIAAELFDELLSEAVVVMTGAGEPAALLPVAQFKSWLKCHNDCLTSRKRRVIHASASQQV